MENLINMLPGINSIGDDSFCFVKLLMSQGNAFAGIGKSGFVFPLGISGDIEPAGKAAAGIGPVFTAVADEGSLKEFRTSGVRADKPVDMGFAVKFHFPGDGGRILVDPAGDSFETQAFGKAFLNFDAVVESQMLELFGRRIVISHDRWSPFRDTFPRLTSTS